MVDSKKAASLGLLGWNFFLHLFKRYVLRKKSPGYDDFIENYKADNIAPFSAIERERLPFYQRCIVCGACDILCPSLNVLGNHLFVGPMGIASCLSRDPTQFSFAPDIFRCVICEACDKVCPEKVPVSEIVVYMKRKSHQLFPELLPPFYRKAVENIRTYGNVYRTVPKPAYATESSTLYWRGCYESYLYSNDDKTANMKLLDNFGILYQTMEERCCGGLPQQMGIEYDFSPTREKILSLRIERIITSCPLCQLSLSQKLPELEVLNVVEAISNRSIETSDILNGKRCAYHDPCILGRKLGIYDAPRTIIEKMGASLVRLSREKEEAPCCGAGGAFGEVNPELSRKIARDRIEEVLDSGAEILVTACDMCARQLGNALSQNESLKILTLAELLLKN